MGPSSQSVSDDPHGTELKSLHPNREKETQHWAEDSPVVEHSPSVHEALGSMPSTDKKTQTSSRL